MRLPRVQLTLRQTMVLVALVAFGLLVVYRDAPILGAAYYHAGQEAYWRNLVDALDRHASQGPLGQDDDFDRYDTPIRDQLAYHAHWRRVLIRSTFRFWERRPAISLDFPPRRSVTPPP